MPETQPNPSIQIVADTHTHTIACDHAYSTLQENIAAAKRRGLRFLCYTEHAPEMIGGPSPLHFGGLNSLPRYLDGVMLLKGAELNIMDYEGTVDLGEQVLKKLEWVIASYHTPCVSPATELEHTKGWIAVAHNPLIHVIGHCGDPRYAFELRTVIREFAAADKIVEINNHSFHARPGSGPVCREVAILCAEFGVPVVLSTDSHYCEMVGLVPNSAGMLAEIGFPEELILNADADRFLEAARRTSGKQLTDEPSESSK